MNIVLHKIYWKRPYLCSFVLNGWSGVVAADGMRALHRGTAGSKTDLQYPHFTISSFYNILQYLTISYNILLLQKFIQSTMRDRIQ